LQEQTTLAVKLQAEIDEYEWYDEDEVEEKKSLGSGAATGAVRRPPSRPPSTRPLEQHRLHVEEMHHAELPQLNLPTSSLASLASSASYATATGLNDGAAGHLQTPDSQSFASNSASSSPSQPEPPPRRETNSSRRSWNSDVEPQHTYATHLRYLYL